jgi:hypothetical protein
MAEKLGEAVLELRTDDSKLTAGMAKAKASAQDLDRSFVSSGRNVERSLAGLTSSTTVTGAAASKMASQAQLSARAAVGLATGATTATVAVNNLGHGSALATRELLVLMREASRGNFTRMAGSATILSTALQSSGQTVKGLVGNLLVMFGLVKTTTDAELALEAASAAAGAGAVAQAAAIAAAKVSAADVELALAQAQARGAVTADQETAAQVRLAAAHEAVAAAAAEATIAEEALAVAQGRAAKASEAEASTAVRALTTRGAVLAGTLTGTAVAAGLLYTTFKVFQDQVRQSGELDRYAASLGLTKKEMKELRQEVGGLSSKEMKDLETRARAFQITWGDVFHGLAKTASDALDLAPAWKRFKQQAEDGWISVLKSGANAAAHIYGLWVGAYRTIVDRFGGFGNAIGSAFIGAVNAAIGAINKLMKAAVGGINGLIDQANRLPLVNLGHLGLPQIGAITDSYAHAGKAAGKSFSQNVAEATAEAQKQIAHNVATIWANIIGAAETRIRNAADTIIEDRTAKKPKKPRKQSDHGLAEALAELDAQIRGQWRLAAAYEVSDAAAVKAEALQKAEEQAIRHKGEVGIFYEKELALAVASRAADGAKVIADLGDETRARAKVNEQIAAGLIPAGQMQQQLELEARLRPLLIAYEIADARHKAAIGDEIKRLITAQAGFNRELSRTQQLQDMRSADDEIERLRLEASLIGASNRERAVALAQLEAEQRLRSMPGLSPAQQQDYISKYIQKANASITTPFQEWAKGVPQTAAAINEALQSIEVKGFDGLSNAITNVLMGTQSLKEAFGELARSILADLIQMTIKMLIFRAVMAAFGGGSVGGLSAGKAADGMAFGGFHAGGGLIPAGTFGIVGEKGPEPVIATPRGAMVMPNSSMRSGVANDRGMVFAPVFNNDFRGADSQSVAAIQARQDEFERDLPGRVVMAMQDARQRFVWR